MEKECLEIEQHNPSSQYSTNDESFKEAKTDEKVRIRKPHDNKTKHSKTPQKKKKKQSLRNIFHLHSDVVNKTLLRAVKRYFLNKFKIQYSSLAKRRSENVEATDILDALAEF